MEYKEYSFPVNSRVSYDYYSDKPIINYNTDKYETLGFKDNKPVVRFIQMVKELTSALVENQSATTQVNVHINPSTEKKTFIYINGKKVCVVPTKLNVVPVKFPLKTPLTKCIGQPPDVTNKQHSDQQTLNLSSSLKISVLKPHPKPTINVNCENTVVKLENTDQVNVKMEQDSVFCESDSNSDSFGNSPPEGVVSADIVTSRSVDHPIRTYSRCAVKKMDLDAARDVKQVSSNVIDYEKRVIHNIRTYKTRKSVSTSCDDLYNSVAVSTQTTEIPGKTVKTVETQTEFDLNIEDDFLNSILTLDSSSTSSGTMSMGNLGLCSNFAGLGDSSTEKIMQQFFNDFKDCMNYNSKGNLPIHEGVLINDIKLVKRNCVVLQAKQEGIDILNHDNLSPLQLGILNETNEDIIELLLTYGADLGAMDTEGNNVLHLAIENSRRRALEIMMKFAKKNNFDIDTFNYEGLSPLMLCCINRSHDMAKLLLMNGADPNLRDLKSGRTALFHASENHDLDMIKLLLKYKADTKIRNFFGTSPHDAMFEVDDIPEGIKLLILGKDRHVKIHQKRRSNGSRFVISKKAKYATKTLNMVSTIQRISSKVAVFKKSS